MTNIGNKVFSKNIQTNVIFHNKSRIILVLGITKTPLSMLQESSLPFLENSDMVNQETDIHDSSVTYDDRIKFRFNLHFITSI